MPRLFLILSALLLAALAADARAQWPMSNDQDLDLSVADPVYEKASGPAILLDGAHHNFFVQWDFIQPFATLAENDGYRTRKGEEPFTPQYLAGFDIVMIITALPFDFTTNTEVTTETTFTGPELDALQDWVARGGSLLVFSEHAPFDQAINPLLNRFGITSSIGTIGDPVHYDKVLGRDGWTVFSRENGLLNTDHPMANGRHAGETINSVAAFGGSSLTGEQYENLFRLSGTAENRDHPTGVKAQGMGVSQALAGTFGKGRIAAFGDSNGFTAMNFDEEDGKQLSLGMNTPHHDWKQMVLNTLHWLSGDL